MNWRVLLNGTDITAYCSGVQTRFEADAICGEVEVSLASRAPLAGIVVPRVPQALSIAVDEHNGVAWVSRGEYFLEEIGYPQDTEAKTATIWGRSWSARLTTPWAQKVSKQWATGETIASIIAEVVNPPGVTFSLDTDYDVCQYCYAVSDQTPAEIIRDLATRSGQIIWPQVDGSIVIAPRLYTYGVPDVVLSSDDIIVESLDRQVPDFGNRILVSGDAAVSGLSVQVVPLADEDACVVADGQSTVRLIAIVTGADGDPVALGTEVEWSASSGLMSAQTSITQSVIRQAEVHQADSYTKMTLDLPAESVIGCYRRTDVRRARNYYTERGGSVSGRVITFSAPLDYYDQTMVVDYIVQGAPITWTAGRIPGDVTVLASVAGAQGYCTIHQSNPTACATQISLEASPSSPCLGDAVAILLKTTMFGGAGVGAATFGMQGCGSLSSTRKTLAPREITETLRTSIWGGAVEVRLTAVPAAGTTPSVVLAETPGANLYESHDGQVVILSDDTILPGTQVEVTYVAGGTALISWLPSALPSGTESIVETLLVTHSGEAPDTVAQVTLTRTPVAAPSCIPLMEISNFYASHDNKVVTLLEDSGVILPVGTQVQCSYQSVWQTQPGCSAIITVRVDDGSEDGGRGQISVSARDCRTVNPSGGSGSGSTYDPEDPDQIPDETTDPEEEGDDDPTSWLEPEEEEVTPTGCGPESINQRTPTITAKNHDAVFVGECPGTCTCDEICAALRSTGRLSVEANMTYSTCMAACAAARDAKCTPCSLDGPSILNPGQDGTWTDGKGNSGEWSGQIPLKSRTFVDGYVATMPTGGAGPFTVRVCYGETPESCCEAQVDFPPCSLSGPTELDPGDEGVYIPSAGVTGASCTCSGDMTIVRATSVGFVCKMSDTGCAGTVTVAYGGRICDSIAVTNPLNDYTGTVSGDAYLGPGESATYYHDLGAGAAYTGDLPVIRSVDNGVICMMPANAPQGAIYEVSFTGLCNSSASMTVSNLYDTEGNCLAPGYGCGCPPGPGTIVSNGESSSDPACYRVGDSCWTSMSTSAAKVSCPGQNSWLCLGTQIRETSSVSSGDCGCGAATFTYRDAAAVE
jgi:hypothetical protein